MSFFSSLSTLATVGISLSRGLAALRDTFSHRASRAAVEALREHLHGGAALSDAMAALPGVFTRIQIGSVRAGEASGSLSVVLARLARHDEHVILLTRQIRSLLVYPVVVFSGAIVLMLALGHVLLGGLRPVLEQMNVPLGTTMRLILALDRHPALSGALAAAFALILSVLLRALRTPRGAAARDRFLLGLPLLGTVYRKIETMRVCEALATMHGCGLGLLRALDLASDACATSVAREAVRRLNEAVRTGRTLAEAMQNGRFFGGPVHHLIAVGEETGHLDAMLARAVRYHEVEVRSAMETFTAAMEPLMLIVLGIVVTAIILVCFGPLYQALAAVC